MDCSPPGLSVHGDSPGKNTGALPSSRGSSWPRDWSPHLLCLLHWQEGSLPLGNPSFLSEVKWSEVSRVWLCDPMDHSLPGFSVHGIFQARVLEWVAISFSRGSSWPRDQTHVSCIAGRRFTLWATYDPNLELMKSLWNYLDFWNLLAIFLFWQKFKNMCLCAHIGNDRSRK